MHHHAWIVHEPGRRLEPLEEALGTTAPGPDRDRIRDEIQAILYALGCESLDENAEWLLRRRARPLEPFAGG